MSASDMLGLSEMHRPLPVQSGLLAEPDDEELHARRTRTGKTPRPGEILTRDRVARTVGAGPRYDDQMVGGDATRSAPRTVGRYVVYGEIASGGMATVHFGRLTGVAGFARSVAIKCLHPQYARDPDFVKMFLDEARLAARITHPNVVATLDVVSEGDDLLLVMDYVRGVSLSQLARIVRARGERIPPLIVSGIVAGVLHGLHAAHEAKNESGERLDIVHRDVSPQNALVGTDGVARVLDFGVAKAAGRLQTTRDGQLKGKLSYMAPEQIHGAAVTRRTDIYAASVVLWEALTGERLFKGENEGNVLAKVLSGEVRPPSALVEGLASSLDRIVLRGLERDAAKRYATAREMAQDLDASFGVASAAEIGDWVEHVAAQELEERAKRIAQIESGAVADDDTQTTMMPSSPGRGAPDAPTPVGKREVDEPTRRQDAAAPAPPEASSQVSSVSVSQTAQPPSAAPRKRGPWIAVAIAGAVVVGGIIVVVATHGSGGETPAPSAAAAAPPPAAPSPPPAPSPEPPAETAEAPSPSTPTIAASALPVAPPTAPPMTAAPARASPPRPHGGGGSDCNPPYTTDAKGHVHFKPQCM
jgi:serine/threonine protein kinase